MQETDEEGTYSGVEFTLRAVVGGRRVANEGRRRKSTSLQAGGSYGSSRASDE